MKYGFSLIELSIVLVILGLLTGGILTGQSLIKAAELRAISTEFSQISTAVSAFKGKYFSLPGDMANATSFWGDNTVYCASAATPNGTPGTCNGNADGRLDVPFVAPGSPTANEIFMFWNQLSLAGMMEGQYSGVSGSGSFYESLPGQNVPASKYPSSAWGLEDTDYSAGTASHYVRNYGKYIVEFGAVASGDDTDNPVLTPEEAWNIDKKMDDGHPAYGKISGVFWNNLCSVAKDGSSAMNDLNADYKLSDTAKRCSLVFIEPF